MKDSFSNAFVESEERIYFSWKNKGVTSASTLGKNIENELQRISVLLGNLDALYSIPGQKNIKKSVYHVAWKH